MLESHSCNECGTPVRVARVTPLSSEEERKQVTGWWARYMDQDFITHNRGHICFDCAMKQANTIGGKGGIVGGGPIEDWEFHYNR